MTWLIITGVCAFLAGAGLGVFAGMQICAGQAAIMIADLMRKRAVELDSAREIAWRKGRTSGLAIIENQQPAHGGETAARPTGRRR